MELKTLVLEFLVPHPFLSHGTSLPSFWADFWRLLQFSWVLSIQGLKIWTHMYFLVMHPAETLELLVPHPFLSRRTSSPDIFQTVYLGDSDKNADFFAASALSPMKIWVVSADQFAVITRVSRRLIEFDEKWVSFSNSAPKVSYGCRLKWKPAVLYLLN